MLDNLAGAVVILLGVVLIPQLTMQHFNNVAVS
jgi:hypothetical protein